MDNKPDMKISGMMILLFLIVAGSCRTSGEGTQNEAKRASNQASGEEITGKHWKLSQIGGETVDWKGEKEREPHILLVKEEKRFYGNGGCNYLAGFFDIRKKGTISFTRIGNTKMACLKMETERQLLEALSNADRYFTDGLILELYHKDVLLARFVAASRE
jgi:heat shock protein HslJ